MTNQDRPEDTMSGHEAESGSPLGLRSAVDRWGPDPARWPDATFAQEARFAMLSDRAFRAYCDDANTMAMRLEAAAMALDGRIAGDPLERITKGVMAAIQPRPAIRWHRRIAAAAAAVIVAGALGGASGLFFNLPGDQQSYSVVQIDPLLFGPSSEQDF